MNNNSQKIFDKCSVNYQYFFNKNLLKNKVAFVTGGGSGIGFSIAEVFVRHGCNVVIASRNLKRIESAVTELSKLTVHDQKCLGFQMDVRKPDSIISIYEKIASNFKRLDILINCAAGNFLSPITNLSPNAYQTVLSIDTVGTFLCSKYAYETFFQKQNNGVILNVSATLHYRGTPLQAHAGSAKAAIDALTKHMSVEWGCSNVRVIGIAPGVTDGTEGIRRLSTPIVKERILDEIPLRRLGTTIEVANATLFLVSDAASYVTGTTLVSDGGHYLTSGFASKL